ncbi:hypothetical protein GCM10027093_38330 [Paraburkholderia jirisanensis]
MPCMKRRSSPTPGAGTAITAFGGAMLRASLVVLASQAMTMAIAIAANAGNRLRTIAKILLCSFPGLTCAAP